LLLLDYNGVLKTGKTEGVEALPLVVPFRPEGCVVIQIFVQKGKDSGQAGVPLE
jgi:hypothetical protein